MCPCERTREFLASRLAETETALTELRTLRNEMHRTLRTWDEMPDGTRESPCLDVEAKLDDRACLHLGAGCIFPASEEAPEENQQ